MNDDNEQTSTETTTSQPQTSGLTDEQYAQILAKFDDEEEEQPSAELEATEQPAKTEEVEAPKKDVQALSDEAARVLKRERKAIQREQEAKAAKREAEEAKKKYSISEEELDSDADAALAKIGWDVEKLSKRIIYGKPKPDELAEIKQSLAELKAEKAQIVVEQSFNTVYSTILQEVKQPEKYPYLSQNPDDEVKAEVWEVMQKVAASDTKAGKVTDTDAYHNALYNKAATILENKYRTVAQRYAPKTAATPEVKPLVGARTLGPAANSLGTLSKPKTREQRMEEFYAKVGIKD